MKKAIEGEPLSIRDIFQNEFEIPEFQRLYSWGNDECEQLWDDLRVFLEKPDSEQYFLGSIAVYPKDEESGIQCVIDGQQRLTTLLMLIHVFYEKVKTDELKNIIYIKNSEPRIKSKVGRDKKDKESLCNILKGKNLKRENRFNKNYQLLKSKLEKWWENKSKDDMEVTKKLLDNVVMSFIQRKNADNASTLFQTINSRSMPLDDTDIFKAQMFETAENKDDFINRWNKMDNHWELFANYMQIHMAEEGNHDKHEKTTLRKYILEECMKEDQSLNNSNNIMINLEKCNWLEKNKLSDNDGSGLDKREKVYWKILENYPHPSYCLYPLRVFLCKHADYDSKKDMLYLDENKRKIYMELIEDTVRHFLFKGLVYKDKRKAKARDISHEVCSRIADKIDDEKDYIAKYKAVYKVDSKEKEEFWKLLDSNVWGKYAPCIIFLGAFLNAKQKNEKVEDYITFLEGEPSIEHIFPREGDPSVLKEPDKKLKEPDKKRYWFHNTGNLVPIERRINSSAGKKSFSEKKKIYRGKESKVQDVIDLSNDPDELWDDEKIKDRREKILDRFKNFFGPMYYPDKTQK